MSPFDYLILAHLLGDFPLQTSWMAINKTTKWFPLIAHSLLYTATLGVIAFFGFGGLAWWQLLAIFLAHVLLDRRRFVTWWITQVMRTDLSKNQWLGIMVDQVFHVTLLALILQIS
ncbi:DUF3307 domain-containing protein [Desulfosporosinus sp. BICA1-9]|uniref:DUF3307 domain-containing protein n=1 Tax=Desulfosporosinus sp. BICA1-9 TaxID=1531958 RepID=UPI00054C54E2|nr:DUF3307 domain-containing protein [Desulfosporosinus sp. BICA1-9]KJS46861.1 MAG: hypothetical protein VR66_23000 [Peptococcaceae bacterium BRH_c23]KJS81860.1 MAG: hypothetical protein JL57_25790 [Desulfosporosinus sp. BICA1-9]HBW35705.1 DUF3307 domain-containing protein [Desulfosporosinus sp.]